VYDILVSTVTCPTPPDVQGIRASVIKSSYSVGETVTYTCNVTWVMQTRTCTSEGTWTTLSELCDGESDCHNTPTLSAIFAFFIITHDVCFSMYWFEVILRPKTILQVNVGFDNYLFCFSNIIIII